MDFNNQLQRVLNTINEAFSERTFKDYLLKLFPEGWTVARMNYDTKPIKMFGPGPRLYVSLLPPSHDHNQRMFVLQYNITIDFAAKTIGFTGPNKLLIKQSYTDFDETIKKMVKDISNLAAGGMISLTNHLGQRLTLKDAKRTDIETAEIQSQTSVGKVTIGDVWKSKDEWFYSFLIEVTEPVDIEGLDCNVVIFGQIGTDSTPGMDWVITKVEQYRGNFMVYDATDDGSVHSEFGADNQIQKLAQEALHDQKIMEWIEQFHESFIKQNRE